MTDIISGLLVHSVCLELMYKIFINFDNKIFFNIFKNKINDYGCIKNINYKDEEYFRECYLNKAMKNRKRKTFIFIF